MSEKLYPLTDRGLLALTGPDAPRFLNGLCTQNCLQLEPHRATAALHLTAQGRFLYDFFILPQADGSLWLDCFGATRLEFAKSLYRYKLREAVEFHDLTDDYAIYAALPGAPALALPAGSQVVTDPRLPALGQRLYVPTHAAWQPEVSPLQNYAHARIALGVPDGAYDCTPDRSFPNEFCFGDLHAIDYHKGCYLGQELTARTHFRTQPKKRLVHITWTGPRPATGAVIVADGAEVGTVLSVAPTTGLAHVRLTAMAAAAAGGPALKVGETTLAATKPSWAGYELTPATTD